MNQLWNIIRNGRVIAGPCTLREVDHWIEQNAMLIPDVDYTVAEVEDRRVWSSSAALIDPNAYASQKRHD